MARKRGENFECLFRFLFVHIDSGPQPALVARSKVHVVDLAKSCVIGFGDVCSVQCTCGGP